MSAIVVSGGHVLGSGGAVFATGSGGGGGTQINYVLAPTTTTATVYLTVVGTYSLYRNGTLIASSQSSSTYNDTGLSANTTYTYSLTSGGGGFTVTTPVFVYTSFAGTGGTINVVGNGSVQGNSIRFLGGGHVASSAWYDTQQPPGPFTTTFTFQPTGWGSSNTATGITFCVQDTVYPPGNNGATGRFFTGDANMDGYGGGLDQGPPQDAVAIKFDMGGTNGVSGQLPSSTGIYLNGSPSVYPGQPLSQTPSADINPYGINFYSFAHV